jgi:hypothetical protein
MALLKPWLRSIEFTGANRQVGSSYVFEDRMWGMKEKRQ